MRAAALLALLLLVPGLGLAALPGPGQGMAPQGGDPPFFVRADPDGGRTLTLWVEDDPGGTYAYTPLPPPPDGDLREVGTYTHAWSWNGVPELTLGVYAVHRDEGLLRVPRYILENTGSEQALGNALIDALLRYDAPMVEGLSPFLLEVAAPSAGDPTVNAMRFPEFRDHPLVAIWTARRVLPGAEAWLGSYVDRDGETHAVPGGIAGTRSAEIGVLARVDGEDLRLAGAYVEQQASAVQQGEERVLQSHVTVGARTPAGRVPLAAMEARDWRTGPTTSDPEGQESTVSLGVDGPDGYLPLLGVRTRQTQRFHGEGREVEAVTAVGAYVDGGFVPLAGTRYHADRRTLADLPFRLLGGGVLGSDDSGDAELSVGFFPEGSYAPLAQVALDDHFPGATMPHRTMVSVGAFTPLRYQPLAAATYEGTDSLLDWALRVVAEDETGSAWMVSAGPWAGQLYAPVVGVRFRGDAPGSTQPHQAEVAAGTFLLAYPAFVPLVAAGASSDDTFFGTALLLASQGPGNQGGAWGAGVGSYPVRDDAFVPLVQVASTPVQDPEASAASDLTVLLAGVPVLGVQYRGEEALLHSFGAPGDPGDDRAWRAAVGVHGPQGFVPLLRVAHDDQGSTLVLGPDLGA